jgi:hypothetical protein
MLVIFPFEETFYRERGVQAEFVGHPLADLPLPNMSRDYFAMSNYLNSADTWIALLPGSRAKEIRDNLPEMLAAARLLAEHALQKSAPQLEFLLPLAPTLNPEHRHMVNQIILEHGKDLTVRVIVDDNAGSSSDGAEGASGRTAGARAALLHAGASIVASGTATVEAALIGNPFVVVYRVSPLTSERPTLAISGYVIDAEIDTGHAPPDGQGRWSALPRPKTPSRSASAFTRRSRSPKSPTRPARCSPASARRRHHPRHPRHALCPRPAVHWTFEYEGVITGNEDGPVEGLKLAAIQEPITYLLYPARWFPHDRLPDQPLHRRDAHPRAPGDARLCQRRQGASKPVTLANGKPGDEYDFNWTKPGFPGTVIAGRYVAPVSAGPGNVKVYLTVSHQQSGNELAQTAAKEYDFFTDSFGAPRPATSMSSNCPTTRCPPSGRRSWPRFPARAWATRAAFACWPTPSPTSGGAPRSARAPSTTPGSPTAWPATAS